MSVSPPISGLRRATLLAGMGLLLSLPAMAQVIYVDKDAPPGGSGLFGWGNAKQELRDALTMSQAGSHEIWVAEGIYKPTSSTTNRLATFDLLNNFQVYGGFKGNETTRADRAGLFATTILSGDLDSNPANMAGDSYHVVSITQLNSQNIILDGFTIERGNANGVAPHDHGGGLTVNGGYGTSGVGQGIEIEELRNCTFRHNRAAYGAGLSAGFAASMPMAYCNFFDNRASVEGGGAWFLQWHGGDPDDLSRVHNVIFERNVAPKGGGVFLTGVTGYTEFYNCRFVDNVAIAGGAGAWVDHWGANSLKFCHSTFAFNQVFDVFGTGVGGAGIYFGSSSTPNSQRFFLENTIVWDNTITTAGTSALDGISGPGTASAILGITFSDVWQNSGLPAGGAGNIHGNPFWQNALTRDLTLMGSSPCIDTGSDALIKTDWLDLDEDGDKVEDIPVELRRGHRRIGALSMPGGPPPQPTDMGCYEHNVLFQMP